MTYLWKPIEPWTLEWRRSYLPEAFAELRTHLIDSDWRAFNERAAREWSIETGQIENAFDITRGATIHLIREGFIASLIGHQKNGLSQEQVHAILMDTKEALDGLFAFVKSEQPLTTSFIKQLHQQLMRSIDHYDAYYIDPNTNERVRVKKSLEKGKYKDHPNSPFLDDGTIHEYCPPEHVAAEMDHLVHIYAGMSTTAEVRAAWLHHAFTQIHPFQDGNGRVARALASLELIRGGLPAFTVIRDMRDRYLIALRAADEGAPKQLLQLFESCLYRQVIGLWREINLPESVRRTAPVEDLDSIIKAAKQALLAKEGMGSKEWGSTDSKARSFSERVARSLYEIAERLTKDLGSPNDSAVATVRSQQLSSSERGVAYVEKWGVELIQASYPVAVTRLTIRIGGSTIDITLDQFSQHQKGFCGWAAEYTQGAKRRTLGTSSFFLNFKDPQPEKAFQVWLDDAIKQGLIEWQLDLTR